MNNVENNNLTQSVIDLQADKEGALMKSIRKASKQPIHLHLLC